MFKFVEKNRRFAKGIMITVTIFFIVWGIGGYLSMVGDTGEVAKVGNARIYKQNIDNAMQENPQQNDKIQTMFSLINRQLLINNINDHFMTVTNDQLQNEISKISIFQESGEFSPDKYKKFLKSRFIGLNQFEKDISDQILLNDFINFFKTSYISSTLFNQQFALLLSRERQVSSYAISAKSFFPSINISESDINNFYASNINTFTTKEMAKVEYVKLDTENITNSIKISEEEISKYLKTHQENQLATKRHIAHILFMVPKDASASTQNEIKEKAIKILKLVKANPKKFSQYAKEYSQDQATAAKGGDLGFVSRGVMVLPFEEVAFKLNANEISDIVTTVYGYHIIKSYGTEIINQNQLRKLAINELKKQKSKNLISQTLESFTDGIFKESQSYSIVSKDFNLPVQTSNWIEKGETKGIFSSKEVQDAIFSPNSIKNRINSNVIDLKDGAYLSLRIIDYKPSKLRVIQEVKDEIIEKLKLQKGTLMTFTEGQKILESLNKGSKDIPFSNPQKINILAQSESLNSMTLKQIFGTSIKKLPAYTGAISAKNEFIIYKITGENINPNLLKQNQEIIKQFDNNNSMVNLGAYLNYLRTKYKVSYKTDKLSQQ